MRASRCKTFAVGRYGPAPALNVVEDLFSQHIFLEGSVLTASAGARSGS